MSLASILGKEPGKLRACEDVRERSTFAVVLAVAVGFAGCSAPPERRGEPLRSGSIPSLGGSAGFGPSLGIGRIEEKDFVLIDDLEKLRLLGSRHIDPDPDNDVISAFHHNRAIIDLFDKMTDSGISLTGTFSFCIDESGHVVEVGVHESTTDRRYDWKVVNTMRSWVFRPFVKDGRALRVCSRVVMRTMSDG